jgi:hypothetical protein
MHQQEQTTQIRGASIKYRRLGIRFPKSRNIRETNVSFDRSQQILASYMNLSNDV